MPLKRQLPPKWRFLVIIMSFILGWFLLHTTWIIWDGLTDHLQKADVAVVFGNKIELTGQPSARLQARLDRAIEVYKQGFVSQIIVSGGIGVEGFDEAQVMKDYLIAHQIPATQIITDNRGNDTYLTVKNCTNILPAHNLHSVMIISQYFHISRARLAFKQAGITELSNAHAYYFEWRDIYSFGREFIGFYGYLIFKH